MRSKYYPSLRDALCYGRIASREHSRVGDFTAIVPLSLWVPRTAPFVARAVLTYAAVGERHPTAIHLISWGRVGFKRSFPDGDRKSVV